MKGAALGILVTGFLAAALGSAFAASHTPATSYHSSSDQGSSQRSSRSYGLRTFTGEVISIGRDNLRVRVGRYTYLVRNPKRAKVTIPGMAQASVSDIAVGDIVRVNAYRVETGIYSPRTIQVLSADEIGRGPAQFPQRYSFVGAVSEINASDRTLTVRTMGGRTYQVDASGASILDRGRPSDFGSLKIGDSVRVRGSLKDHVVTAETINEITAGYVGQPTTLIGVLSSLNPTERYLVIFRANRLITVDVPTSARVLMHQQPIGLATIPKGSTIKVKGRWINSNTVEARYVEVFPAKQR